MKALITGASEGIGRAFAKKLAKEGYEITAVARNEKRLKELIESLGNAHHTYLVANLSRKDGIQNIAQNIFQTHYDLLINNAGFGLYSSFQDTPLDKLHEMVSLNCLALMELSYAFIQNAQPGDILLNVSSVLSFIPFPFNGVYAASKAFVTSFSESLAYEQKEKGIAVIALCPGVTETQFHVRATNGGEKTMRSKIRMQTPAQVVERAFKAIQSKSSGVVIPGVQNKVMTELVRFMPRSSLLSMVGKVAKKVLPTAPHKPNFS